jgi:hypothetical protein
MPDQVISLNVFQAFYKTSLGIKLDQHPSYKLHLMKVKFFSNYTDPASLLKRFKANYRLEDNVMQITAAEDYNYAVVFNSTADKIKKEAKVITIIQEPTWSDAFGIDAHFLQHSDILITHDPALLAWRTNIKLGGHLIVAPSLLFYNDKIDKAFFAESHKVPKKKKLSIIMSSLRLLPGNYTKRLNLLKTILASDLEIDIFGGGLQTHDCIYKGELEYKHQGLLPYEYSIAIENCNEYNYVTEKFMDCTLCATIPIYNGAPNIKEIYDADYIRYIDLDSNTIIDDIRKIIAQPAPLNNTNAEIYFTRYNLYAILKDIIMEYENHLI